MLRGVRRRHGRHQAAGERLRAADLPQQWRHLVAQRTWRYSDQPTGLGADDKIFRLDRAAGEKCVPLVDDKAESAALAKVR